MKNVKKVKKFKFTEDELNLYTEKILNETYDVLKFYVPQCSLSREDYIMVVIKYVKNRNFNEEVI